MMQTTQDHRSAVRRGVGLIAIWATVLAGVLMTGTSAAAQARDDHVTRIDPAALPQGTHPTLPHFHGDVSVLHHRDLVLPLVFEHQVTELWKTRGGYLVRTMTPLAERSWLWAVDRLGEKTLVAAIDDGYRPVAVNDTRERVAWAVVGNDDRLRVRVSDAVTGERLFGRRLGDYLDIVDFAKHRVLLGSPQGAVSGRTVWWRPRAGDLQRVIRRPAFTADTRAGQLSFLRYTDEPGEVCTDVAKIRRPGTRLWSHCRRAPIQWSRDGERATALHPLTDGLGPVLYDIVNTANGNRVHRFRSGSMGYDHVWIGNRALLFKAQRWDGFAALVRCSVRTGACERASRLFPVQGDDYNADMNVPIVLPSR